MSRTVNHVVCGRSFRFDLEQEDSDYYGITITEITEGDMVQKGVMDHSGGVINLKRYGDRGVVLIDAYLDHIKRMGLGQFALEFFKLCFPDKKIYADLSDVTDSTASPEGKLFISAMRRKRIIEY